MSIHERKDLFTYSASIALSLFRRRHNVSIIFASDLLILRTNRILINGFVAERKHKTLINLCLAGQIYLLNESGKHSCMCVFSTFNFCASFCIQNVFFMLFDCKSCEIKVSISVTNRECQ